MDHYHHYLLHDIKNNLQKINIYLMFLNNLINLKLNFFLNSIILHNNI